VEFPIALNEHGGSSIALPPEVQKGGGPNFSEILRTRADIHHQPLRVISVIAIINHLLTSSDFSQINIQAIFDYNSFFQKKIN